MKAVFDTNIVIDALNGVPDAEPKTSTPTSMGFVYPIHFKPNGRA
ncbi:MAG TPA: hypothetical protein VGK87_05785 [Anaerolineae bacterium]|jgi:hypothetical protein